MSDPRTYVRQAVRAAPAYGLVREQAPVKLNQNESPFDIPPELKEEVFRRLGQRPWNRYAQEVPNRVAALLAQRNDWPPEGVVLGGGSNLLLELLAFGVCEGTSVVLAPTPCFALYRLIAGLAGARLEEIPFGESFVYDTEAWCAAVREYNPALAFLCSPNNPTGSFFERDGVEAVASECRGIVVVDEAYREFAGEDRRDLLERYRNMVLVRTFSKAFSGAGIRLGYLLAHVELAAELRKLVPPFNVNVLTATVAEVLLENAQVLAERVRVILSERERLLGELKAVPGVSVYPTRGNFFLLRTPLSPGRLSEGLTQRGVLVRLLHGPGLERTVRVNVGTPRENDAFLAALREVLAEAGGHGAGGR